MGWRVDNDLQQMLRESAKAHLSANGGPAHFRAVRAHGHGFDAAAWKAMAELGWTGILLTEAQGGSELGLEPALTLAEELGQALSPEPFVASAVIAATLLAAAQGGAAQALARALAAGETSITVAWQEARGSIGLGPLETVLHQGRLNGRKLFVPAWHDSTALLVAAREGDDIAIVSIDPATPGMVLETRVMTDGSHEASLVFNAIAVADTAIILRGREARAALERALANGTLALCAKLDGLTTRLWHMTADYLRQRVQFDQPIADFQAVRHRMVDLYSGIELAAASWRAGLKDIEAGQSASLALHAAKARCSDVALEMGRWAIQYHGAFGYTEEADVGLYLNSALRWASWLGNAAAHRRAALHIHGQPEHQA